jgi:hypothetical protein
MYHIPALMGRTSKKKQKMKNKKVKKNEKRNE